MKPELETSVCVPIVTSTVISGACMILADCQDSLIGSTTEPQFSLQSSCHFGVRS